VLAAAVAPAIMASGAQPPATAGISASRCSTSYLALALRVPHVTVDFAVLDTTGRYTPPGSTTPITGLHGFCAVALTQNDSARNPIHIAVWLPVKWNGRFQGIGGGGYSCGISYAPTAEFVSPSLDETVKGGYASASTDYGNPVADAFTGAWGLKLDSKLNWPLINDWASAGIHDMTVAREAVTRAYYPGKLSYSGFDGCSTGGREALQEAQQYPDDYNGIVAGSPAINWPSWVPAAIWPALVMNQTHDALPTCKEEAFTNAVVKACGTRGVITNPADCHWSAALSYPQFGKLPAQSVREFSSLVATNNPDLSAFRDHGGKIVIWAGTADELINPQGTVQYYRNVQQTMGGATKTDSFARLFLAPGAAHCANGAGPAPTDPVAAVVKWAEHGQAPQSITATLTNPATGAVTLSWPICAYPRVARYTGHGSPSQARNYTCASPRTGTGGEA